MNVFSYIKEQSDYLFQANFPFLSFIFPVFGLLAKTLLSAIPSQSIDGALSRFNQFFKNPNFVTMEYDIDDKMLYVLDPFLDRKSVV